MNNPIVSVDGVVIINPLSGNGFSQLVQYVCNNDRPKTWSCFAALTYSCIRWDGSLLTFVHNRDTGFLIDLLKKSDVGRIYCKMFKSFIDFHSTDGLNQMLWSNLVKSGRHRLVQDNPFQLLPDECGTCKVEKAPWSLTASQ